MPDVPFSRGLLALLRSPFRAMVHYIEDELAAAGFEGMPVLADCNFGLGQCNVEFRANAVVTVWYRYGVGKDSDLDIVATYHRVRRYLSEIGLYLNK